MNELGLGGAPLRQTVKHTFTGAIPVGVAIFTSDQRLQHCTPDFPTLTGLLHNRLPPGLPFNELLAAFQQPPGTSAFRRECSDGRVIEVHSEPLPDGGHVTIVTDITGVRETEDALLLSKAAAETGHAAKTRFLAGMSDALRTPLTSILAEAAGIAGTSDKDCARPASPAEIARSCTVIDTAARSLLGQVQDVLDLARLETGGIELADQPIDFARLLRNTLRRFDPIAAAAEVTLVIDLPVSLPAIRGDEERLRQVLSNVVAHALAGTNASGSISFRIRHDWATGGLRLQIQDTGPSLAEQGLEQLFEPFQPDRHGRAAHGIGLYVGRIVMRAHGGDLTFGSAPGHGITATLIIPADRVVQDGGFDAS